MDDNGNNGWRERAERMEAAFNQRMDRLTERHEALTQSVELMHRDWQERWKQLGAAQAKNEVLMAQTLEAIEWRRGGDSNPR